MRRMWPDEFNFILDGAEEVTLDVPAAEASDKSPSATLHRQALKIRISQQDYERIWPLAEARYRLEGKYSGKAITLITNNPHYQNWHPVDGGTVEMVSDSGRPYQTQYVVVHFLLDNVRETVEA